MSIADDIVAISTLPQSGNDAYNAWIEQSDFLAFLDRSASSAEVLLYASAAPFTYTYALAVPEALLNPLDAEDLSHWSCNPGDHWGINYTLPFGGKPIEARLSAPLESPGSKTLAQARQLVFSRSFEGRSRHRHYYELAQELSQALEIHFVEERMAYCRFDENGDIEDIVRIVPLASPPLRYSGHAITIRRDALDLFLTVTNAGLVLFFDSTRFTPASFHGYEHRERRSIDDPAHQRYGHLGIDPGQASYIRGFQIIRPAATREAVLKRLAGAEEEEQYASFIAYDWKNSVVAEISCSPQALSNYFQKSDLPFDLSPAFFRPEVLAKYKNDTEKYKLEERSITCRNAWHLETYDINAQGQVHTYLKYLSHLPYCEQLYWKAFNEPPKGPISKRAFTTDFLGEFSREKDPLSGLKSLLLRLSEARSPWWGCRVPDFAAKLHYVATESADEWANALLALDQVVVEGLERNYFKGKAREKGVDVDPTWQSIKLIAALLEAQGVVPEETETVIAPLRALHFLRTKMKGHAAGSEAQKIRADVLRDHGSLPKHFKDLVQSCLAALEMIEDLRKKGFL